MFKCSSNTECSENSYGGFELHAASRHLSQTPKTSMFIISWVCISQNKSSNLRVSFGWELAPLLNIVFSTQTIQQIILRNGTSCFPYLVSWSSGSCQLICAAFALASHVVSPKPVFVNIKASTIEAFWKNIDPHLIHASSHPISNFQPEDFPSWVISNKTLNQVE